MFGKQHPILTSSSFPQLPSEQTDWNHRMLTKNELCCWLFPGCSRNSVAFQCTARNLCAPLGRSPGRGCVWRPPREHSEPAHLARPFAVGPASSAVRSHHTWEMRKWQLMTQDHNPRIFSFHTGIFCLRLRVEDSLNPSTCRAGH